MTTYAIIPARGGSKGIINKNLSTVSGRSLIEIGVCACVGANSIDKVFVSTDSTNIMNEARSFGAEIIVRPDDISCDLSSSESAILHAIDHIAQQGFEEPDVVVFYQVTNPFTTSDDIDNAHSLFVKTKADSLFAASPFVGFLWERQKDGSVTPKNHNCSKRLRRQDFLNCFIENGAFYIMNKDGFVKSKHRFFGKIEMFEMSQINAHEIDDPEDLIIANALMDAR